jgi:hypothetical protein
MRRFTLPVPFLLVLASLLQLNYIALIIVSPDQIIRPLMALWTVMLLLLLPSYWITRDWSWAVLLLAVFVIGMCFSSSFFSTMLVFTIVVGAPSLLFLRIRGVKVSRVHAAYFLHGAAVFFVGYSIVVTSNALSRVSWSEYQKAVYETRTYTMEVFSTPPVRRDIYFIVLDGYARSDTLQEMFGFDNSEFVTYLEGLGFFVPASGVSNYPATHLSVASMLNMDYVQTFAPGIEEGFSRWLMNPFIDHSRVRSFLESQGYETITISTNWSITDNPTAGVYFRPYPVILNDFEGFVLDSTPLGLFKPLLSRFASIPSYESQRNIIRFNFTTLADLPRFPGPKFVFSHIISPHPPFVFDGNGDPVDVPYSFSFKDGTEYAGSREEYRQKYVEQVKYVNNNLQEVVAAILANSGVPPIIILQADHGSGMLVDLSSSKNTCVRERFSPFVAYYLPGLTVQEIPSDISAVNLFRVIFNEYYGANLPILESRQYFYTNPVSFYDFEDVTDRLHDSCVLPK